MRATGQSHPSACWLSLTNYAGRSAVLTSSKPNEDKGVNIFFSNTPSVISVRLTHNNVRYRTSERVLCLSKLLFTMRLALIHP